MKSKEFRTECLSPNLFVNLRLLLEKTEAVQLSNRPYHHKTLGFRTCMRRPLRTLRRFPWNPYHLEACPRPLFLHHVGLPIPREKRGHISPGTGGQGSLLSVTLEFEFLRLLARLIFHSSARSCFSQVSETGRALPSARKANGLAALDF